MTDFVRRAAAYAIDVALILAWASVLLLASLALGGGEAGPPSTATAKLLSYLLALATLTAPVILAAAACEARLGATPGKLAVGLRVRTAGERPRRGRALVRNLVKFAPWELAHVGIWTIPGAPFVDPPTGLNVALWAAAGLAMTGQTALIATTGRGVHDRLAKTEVEPRG